MSFDGVVCLFGDRVTDFQSNDSAYDNPFEYNVNDSAFDKPFESHGSAYDNPFESNDSAYDKRIHILEESRFCVTRGISGLTNYDPEKMRVNGSSLRVQTGV